MPVTFNEAEDIWELTNPTEAEKDSLMKIAVGELIDFFGSEMASKIVNEAVTNKLGKTAGTAAEKEVSDGFTVDGQVGQA